MARSGSKSQRKSVKASRNRALNAFDTAVDDEFYVKGLRQQQDIDLEHVADDRIRDLMSGQVNSEDDEDIDSDDAMGSASDISLGEPESDGEDKWGESLDEAELLPLSEVWDINDSDDETGANSKSKTSDIHKSGGVNAAGDASDSEEASEEASEESGSESGESGSDLSSDSDLDQLADNDTDTSESEDENSELLREAIKKVGGAASTGTSSKLVQADEENPFALPQSKSNASLSLEDLVPGAKTSKTLSVPAPQRIQERADRGAAYGLAKEEVDKWADVVSSNRQAEHLQFPINPPPEFESASPLAPTASKDRNSLENSVAQILNDSQLADEKAISTFEEMAPSKLSIEELRERRNKLRYMRELMLREEQRAKRIKKIKSKKYRKIHKKERERMAELERDDEDDNESIEKAERDRALERATLRHKNNSKWAQQILEHGLTRDSNTRADVEEMLRQSDALRQKIRGNEDEGDDDRGNLSDEELRLEKESNAAEKPKGVLGMKFMVDAQQREQEANRKSLHDDFDSDEDDKNIGRKSFNPAGQQLKRDLEAMKESDEYDDKRNTSEKSASRRKHSDRPERGDEVISFEQQDREDTAKRTAEPSSRTQQPPAQTLSENPWVKASTQTSVPGSVKLTPGSRATESGASGSNARKAKIVVENTFGDSLVREKDFSLQQQDLVRQAFAGDDVVAEFEAEKNADIDEAGDQEIDETLPGWGSWSNEKPRVRKIRKIMGVNEKQRKDYKKQNVIINEKLNKKAAKYNASAVPFPFENRQQYERSLRMPIGQEWVSKDTFQRQTKPRVIVKRGSVIDPIKKPQSSSSS